MASFTPAIVECPECGTEFEGYWSDDDSLTDEDVTEAPVAQQTCPACGHHFDVEWPGWMFRSEAG